MTRAAIPFPEFLPSRIVSLQPSATVTLDALGELRRLVACTRYCAEVCPAVLDSGQMMVADSWTAQSHQILAAKPDLVIASVPYQEKAVVEILKSGARFLGLVPKTLADIYADITAIAGLVGAHERARTVIDSMQETIESVRGRTSALPERPRVFCEEWGKPIIHSQTWVKELVEAAGGSFVGIPGSHTTAEEMLAANPDVVITAWCGAGDRVPLEKIIRDRGWEQLPAAQRGRVFCISDELLNTPAPTLLGGLHALAWALHPDVFPKSAGVRSLGQ